MTYVHVVNATVTFPFKRVPSFITFIFPITCDGKNIFLFQSHDVYSSMLKLDSLRYLSVGVWTFNRSSYLLCKYLLDVTNDVINLHTLLSIFSFYMSTDEYWITHSFLIRIEIYQVLLPKSNNRNSLHFPLYHKQLRIKLLYMCILLSLSSSNIAHYQSTIYQTPC